MCRAFFVLAGSSDERHLYDVEYTFWLACGITGLIGFVLGAYLGSRYLHQSQHEKTLLTLVAQAEAFIAQKKVNEAMEKDLREFIEEQAQELRENMVEIYRLKDKIKHLEHGKG